MLLVEITRIEPQIQRDRQPGGGASSILVPVAHVSSGVASNDLRSHADRDYRYSFSYGWLPLILPEPIANYSKQVSQITFNAMLIVSCT